MSSYSFILFNILGEVIMSKEKKEREIIEINEKPPVGKWIPLSIQHTFAMFSASVLVPVLFGIPAVSYTHLDVYKRQAVRSLSGQ